jgi:hypothetical protein
MATRALEAGESILRLSREEGGLLLYVLERAMENAKLFGGRNVVIGSIKRKLPARGGEVRLSREAREALHDVLEFATSRPELFAGDKEHLGTYFSQSVGRIRKKLPKRGSGTY